MMAPAESSNRSNGAQKRTSSSQSYRGSTAKRRQTLWPREILQQSSSTLPANGELNLSTFLATREFEIKALENGLKRSKGDLTKRAFQQVPRDLRRRTASHNVKKVPKRLQKRAAREMKDDNTPTVKQGKKPGNSRSRVRAETAKKLGLLSARKVHKKVDQTKSAPGIPFVDSESLGINGRVPVPKARKGELNRPPKPKSKFRKRQINKTWLPTHLWHAKRAKMTAPKEPLWRFALPLSPTEKCYRPTHRAGGARGAICWDMSFVSTIGLSGSDMALEKLLRGIGIEEDRAWGKAGDKWREGKRSWSGWTSRGPTNNVKTIAPVTILWEPQIAQELDGEDVPMAEGDAAPSTSSKRKQGKRQLIIRVHPSAFLELWTEVLRLSKQQRPIVHVEDLRFEIGSIDITGPDATETLLGILHPFDEQNQHAILFKSLAGVQNASSLPTNALLNFSILDPRLRYPPQKCQLPRDRDENAAFTLLETLAKWPIDSTTPSRTFFDRLARWKATRLPSQKAINRRKSQSPPGAYPPLISLDPEIPIILMASRDATASGAQGKYTILAPWKCILPIWYGLVHYPLTSGGNPRFGGLMEMQQMDFEYGRASFPMDVLAVKSGWEWEMQERQRRKREWDARPKGKKTAYESLDLGCGRKGEVGVPFNCDFEYLLGRMSDSNTKNSGTRPPDCAEADGQSCPIKHLRQTEVQALLSSPSPTPADAVISQASNVRITFLTRGVPQTCARIYRLPAAPAASSTPPTDHPSQLHESEISTASANSTTQSASLPTDLRQQWLKLLPQTSGAKKPIKSSKWTSSGTRPAPIQRPKSLTLDERKKLLAQDLLSQPALPYPKVEDGERYPVVPDEDDVIGFVTSGGFNLAEGKGTAVGTILVSKVLERRTGDCDAERRLCIVRNVGETKGWLARWDVL